MRVMWKELAMVITLLLTGATFIYNVMNDGDAEQRERDREDATTHTRHDAEIRALDARLSRIEGRLEK